MLYGLPRNRCASDAASRWMVSGRNSVWTAESAGMRTARGKPCLCIREISGSPCTGLNMQTGANMRRIMRGRRQRFIKELNGGQRAANLKNAFQLAADIVKYKKILLVDDIYTTGTTIDAVSEILLKGGAERIYYICVSIGAGF